MQNKLVLEGHEFELIGVSEPNFVYYSPEPLPIFKFILQSPEFSPYKRTYRSLFINEKYYAVKPIQHGN